MIDKCVYIWLWPWYDHDNWKHERWHPMVLLWIFIYIMQPHHKYMSAAALESPVKIMGANLSPGKNNTVEVLCGKKVQYKLWQKNFLSKSRNQNKLKQLQKENFGCLKRKEDNVNVSPFFKCPYVFSSPKQGLTALSKYRPNLFCSL